LRFRTQCHRRAFSLIGASPPADWFLIRICPSGLSSERVEFLSDTVGALARDSDKKQGVVRGHGELDPAAIVEDEHRFPDSQQAKVGLGVGADLVLRAGSPSGVDSPGPACAGDQGVIGPIFRSQTRSKASSVVPVNQIWFS